MLLKQEYREDLIELLKELPEDILKPSGYTLTTLLADKNMVDQLWSNYQKSVEEYYLTPDEAIREALKDILGLPDPLDQAMPEAEAWHIETTVSLSLRMKAGETGRQALLRLEQLLQSELTNLADHDITVETIEPAKLSR